MIQNPSTSSKGTYVKKITSLFLFLFIAVNIFAQKQVVSPVYANITDNVKAYYESLPIDYAANPSKKYPVILFIHGVGELGNGSAAQLPKVKNNSGLAKLIDRGGFPTKFTVAGKDYSFIVIAPQFSTQANYTKSINDVLDYVKGRYRIDENRIYLTGLSMGGAMTYDFVGTNQANGAKIAAALGICAAMSSTQAKADNIAAAKVPVWLTVNSGDAASYPRNAKDAVDKIKAKYSTSTSPWITIFNKSGHDAWTQTYDPNFKQNGYNVYEWMLLHARNTASTPVVTTNPPTAKAGSNQTITLPTSTVSLDASASTAASGTTITKYEWTKVTNVTEGNITSPAAVKTTVTGLTKAGSYVFQVRVTDGNGKTATAQVTITVKAAATPVANAGANQTITIPTQTATLNGSGSTSGAGIKAYRWTLVSGPRLSGNITSATAVSTTVRDLVPGVYIYRLTITDNNNATHSNDVVITVKPRVGTLKADAGPDQVLNYPFTSDPVLNGLGSTAPAASTISSVWDKVSGPAGGEVINPSVNLVATPYSLQPGVYEYRLTVRDGNGNSSTDVVKLTVQSTEIKANAGANQTITIPTQTATLNGSGSTSGAGIKAYRWTLVSGPRLSGNITSATAVSTTVRDLVPGVYIYRLTITDNNNATHSNDVVITVKPRVGTLKADAGPDQVLNYPFTSDPVLNGLGSTAPAASTISSVWDKVSGPAGGEVINPSVNLVATPYSLKPGVYEYRLTVRDGNGNSSTDVVKLTVQSTEIKANAGANQTITIPTQTATLNGSGSTSGAGIKAYRWTLVSGPRLSGNITSATAVSTTVRDLVPGVYIYRLTITDNNNATHSNDVVITVKPRVGTLKADAGPDQVLNYPFTSDPVLNGLGSTAPAASTISSVWDKISGPAGGAVINPSVNLVATPYSLQPGVYEYRLTVRDGNGNSSTDVVKITVKATSGRTAGESAATTEEPVANTPANELTVKINPNPVTSSMNVWVDSKVAGKTSVQVYSITGNLLQQKEFVKGAGLVNQVFDVSSLPRGIYVVYVTLDGKERKTVQMIKQ